MKVADTETDGLGVIESADERKPTYRLRKMRLLVGAVVFTLICGGGAPWLPERMGGGWVGLVCGVVDLVLMCIWCALDALERGFEMEQKTKIRMVLFFLLVYPVYLYHSIKKGPMRAFWFSVLFLVFLHYVYAGGMWLSQAVSGLLK